VSRILNLEIEVSPSHGHGFPLGALGLPTSVPAPDSIIIPIAMLSGEEASEAAALLSPEDDMTFLSTDIAEEMLEDDMPDALREVLTETLRHYRTLTKLGWYADIRIRYSW
jgi:hypothetical protein